MTQQQGPSPGAGLRELIGRKDRVLAVLHTPNAALARIMELAGCEAGFVGTSGVVGAYTGLADVGTATMTECVTIAWYPGFTHQVIWAAMWDFMQQFREKGITAWEEFEQARLDRPYPRPEPGPDEEGLEKQRQLEERYFSAEALAKYRAT